ncbi:hypothetical protein AVD76_21960 [Salmonella enterica subsp. enterica serovar Albert]|nr:hypothetical protein [Salmonella enterica subsp. enterica serovar Albert]
MHIRVSSCALQTLTGSLHRGRLIGGGVPRQQVAIIYDVGLSTHGLYWILLSAGRKRVKKMGAAQRSTRQYDD